jgi:hypothetical protein
MSQYPYPFGYGQYYGQYAPPPPYAYSNIPGYHPPTQSTPHNPSATQANRDASQAAYDSNAIHIPGLGIGGTAPFGTPDHLAYNVAAWTQPPSFPGPVPAPNVPPQQAHAASDLKPQPSQPDITSASRNTAQPASQPAPPANRPTADVELEEGELSEGQFEDLYEPREYAPEAPKEVASKPLPLPVAEPSQPASAADTPDGGFYGSDEDDVGKDSRGNEGTSSGNCKVPVLSREGLMMGAVRDRSASYSPFLTPREIQSELPTPQHTNEPIANKGVPSGPAQPVGNTSNPPAPNLQPSEGAAAVKPTSTLPGNVGESASQPQSNFSGSFKSLQDAKKEAQKAILRLWPLGVKYQNYIEEGFDEKLIKGLFRDLHLDIPKTDADSSPQTQEPPRQIVGHDATKPGKPAEVPAQTTPTTTDSSAMADQSQKGEERKDRIARLLAAKAAKAPAAPKQSAPAGAQPEQSVPQQQPQEAATTPPAPPPPKSKTWGEKERLLQQKIAALQKAREAQKSATDRAGSEAVQVGSNGTPASHNKTTGSPAPLSIPPAPKAGNRSQTPATSQPTPSQPHPLLPGLVASSNALPNAPNQRKRPVASDFVEYSSGPVPPKRPFGQTRTETSFIIDVSDESGGEEMDMDMDMGSPVDETLPIQSSGTPGPRGPAIRDFPPLTDTVSQRRFSSPPPSVTPPSGLVNNKRRETELDLKEKAIQEMRRKIALAEARRKAKQASGGSVTPKQAGNGAPRLLPTESTESTSSPDHSDRPSPQLTPEPSSSRLAKQSELSNLDPLKRAERRGRLVSLEIPRVKSSLSEKMKRLQQLQDEQARLKAEIDNSLAEEKRLADELQQLETAPSVETPPPNGAGSGNASDNLSPPGAPHETDGQDDQQQLQLPVSQTATISVDITTHVSPTAPTASVSDRRRGSDEVPRVEAEALQGRGSPPPTANNTETNIADSESEKPGDSAAPLSEPSKDIEQPLAGSDASAREPTRDASASSSTSQPAGSNIPNSNTPEDIDNADDTTPMELDSRSPSPDVAEPVSGIDASPSSPLPDQISSVAQPREAVQEIEAETTGEVNVVSSRSPGIGSLTRLQVQDEPASKPSSTLMPYESPLRYFHAYRFHPEYQHAVAGGLKSLTYSNRIDPDKELCPYELSGEQCPPNCEYQHFGSICPPGESPLSLNGLLTSDLQHPPGKLTPGPLPPDDQILLELGNPDDYSGEQKSRFIQGLRELLQKFKADKVKDFNTIARGIIEFRAQLLGDTSKVLRLDGVTI